MLAEALYFTLSFLLILMITSVNYVNMDSLFIESCVNSVELSKITKVGTDIVCNLESGYLVYRGERAELYNTSYGVVTSD